MKRRTFVKNFSLAVGSTFFVNKLSLAAIRSLQPLRQVVDDFKRKDSLYHGDQWESLNPGYWQLKNEALRRRLHHIGNDNPVTWFPWHWETHRNKPQPQNRDPSLPLGMIWNREWVLSGNFKIIVDFTLKDRAPISGDRDWKQGSPRWQQEQSGYGLMGICFGGKTLYESRNYDADPKNAALMALWKDNKKFGIYSHASDLTVPFQEKAGKMGVDLQCGDKVAVMVYVHGEHQDKAQVKAALIHKDNKHEVVLKNVDRNLFTNGYFGLVARGLLDFQVDKVSIEPLENKPLSAPVNELHTCYPLGDTLRKEDDSWRCKFIALTRSDGSEIAIRIADTEQPEEGWDNVPVAGRGDLVNNSFRRNTAVIEVRLPRNPAESTMYFTVWKDGRDVTGDPRIGTDSMRAGTGLVPFPGKNGQYVGRLPKLEAPYKVAGLGGHALWYGRSDLPGTKPYQENFVHDQPTKDAYRNFEDYEFQILNWDDDVWYMELMFPPSSTDDAYKVITLTIAGPTCRWKTMRHWNVINPGDHDYGMDDVKGPEQYILRHHNDLGQDMYYMRRNFQVTNHLALGDEHPTATDNPKLWRRWKMPNHDFSMLILDARLWRTTQETDIWSEWGWGHKKNLYGRDNPVRSLLGEEQYAWLEKMIHTDTSPLICVSGINNMHPVFQGYLTNPETGNKWLESDRVAADYAGWVKAGCDRVIDLLSSRQGVISVYGDIHLAHILENRENRLIEASFGPIGRNGARGLKEDWAPELEDYDGRPVKIHALYHLEYQSPDLKEREGPVHWNFMEMTFDPQHKDPTIQLNIRHLTDTPETQPRGGTSFKRAASQTGRPVSCRLPSVDLMPDSDVYFYTLTGEPILATRNFGNRTLQLKGLIDIDPGTPILMVNVKGTQSTSKVIKTIR